MNRIFENLYLYEIVLLFLGIFLFMLLCAGLVYFIIKKQDLKILLFFFPIPIIMIAYPSIQEIQIEKDKFALKKNVNSIIENPMDSIAQNELQKISNKLEKRATSVKDIEAVSFANLLLGNSEKVIDLTTKAIKEESENSGADEKIEDSQVSTEPSQEGNPTNLEMLKNIKELAETQNTLEKNLKNNREIFRDTVKLKQQISKIPWQNPETKNFLKKSILKQCKIIDSTKK